ncbi:MAG: hypothetical protein NT076_02955 [Candidatus Pacearchaeota archaeon]|nr:hypothetical protein [Candidatus Pacearchaeota archaeon]
MEKFISTKKSQAWGLDLMMALAIFLVAIVGFYLFSLNQPNEREQMGEMFYDGEFIADNILSEGYPADWNSGNVFSIGILTENKINKTKLERFYQLANSDYGKTKRLFNTKYNYFFLLQENMTINQEEVRGIGKPGAIPEEESENLIKITRFSIYKNKPTTVYVYIWE